MPSKGSASTATTPAAIAASRSESRIARESGGVRISDFFQRRTAEQAGRFQDQHQDQGAEYRDIAIRAAEISGPQRFDDADQQPAEHRTRKRTDAAEHRRREGFDAGNEAQIEIDY